MLTHSHSDGVRGVIGAGTGAGMSAGLDADADCCLAAAEACCGAARAGCDCDCGARACGAGIALGAIPGGWRTVNICAASVAVRGWLVRVSRQITVSAGMA